MNVTKATVVLQRTCMDVVILDTDKPTPVPGVTATPLCLMFHATYDTGEAYVKANFPDVPLTVVPRP